MQIQLSDVLSQKDKVIERLATVGLDEFQMKLGIFPIIEKENLSLRIENTGNKEISIQGNIALWIEIPCGRCLEPVKQEFRLEIDRRIDMKLSEKERMSDLDESDFITGYNLDVDKLVYNEILINWPMNVLCSESCKGICNSCGKNLNLEACGCDVTDLDPRMSVIRDVFSKFKEV